MGIREAARQVAAFGRFSKGDDPMVNEEVAPSLLGHSVHQRHAALWRVPLVTLPGNL